MGFLRKSEAEPENPHSYKKNVLHTHQQVSCIYITFLFIILTYKSTITQASSKRNHGGGRGGESGGS